MRYVVVTGMKTDRPTVVQLNTMSEVSVYLNDMKPLGTYGVDWTVGIVMPYDVVALSLPVTDR